MVMQANDMFGLVVGFMKSICPGCCMINLVNCDKIDEFASLSEILNGKSDDYCSWVPEFLE